jgi:hypothetical protein
MNEKKEEVDIDENVKGRNDLEEENYREMVGDTNSVGSIILAEDVKEDVEQVIEEELNRIGLEKAMNKEEDEYGNEEGEKGDLRKDIGKWGKKLKLVSKKEKLDLKKGDYVNKKKQVKKKVQKTKNPDKDYVPKKKTQDSENSV